MRVVRSPRATDRRRLPRSIRAPQRDVAAAAAVIAHEIDRGAAAPEARARRRTRSVAVRGAVQAAPGVRLPPQGSTVRAATAARFRVRARRPVGAARRLPDERGIVGGASGPERRRAGRGGRSAHVPDSCLARRDRVAGDVGIAAVLAGDVPRARRSVRGRGRRAARTGARARVGRAAVGSEARRRAAASHCEP